MPKPNNLKQAVAELDNVLTDDDKEYIKKHDAISLHHTLGRWIRNEWGLWTGSPLKECLTKRGFNHPDDMSNHIIEEYIKHLNNQ